jgi:NAD(P)-dependent dehydrogenase (short-subunit alcohol dehydrogenase family)
MAYGPETTTDEVLEGVDLSSKVAVITGSSGGLGIETARALASKGAAVVLAARNAEKLATAVDVLRAEVPGIDVSTQIVDLASLDSVRAAAAELAAAHPRIDLLINNAGVMACPFDHTADGFEMQFGTNHLGHFLFTNLLLDSLLASDAARVVALSSAGHRESGIIWDDPNFESTEYFNWTSYGQSKTANALFALELDKRYADQGLHAYSVHPGVIMTELARHMQAEDFEWMSKRAEDSGRTFTFKEVEAGAATSVWAATAAELADHGGAYLEDCGVAPPVDDASSSVGVQTWARDPEQAARLWTMSEEMVGL